ncbi:MAG TPA: type III-A CRISPR-associated RAMP protein Csm3 [Ignavibacteria bacterium]|nr:type III-A CRISPR-associated RAMP protein Csm3 [Ignavibacteria bacterium]HMR40307.1 type III-A CRISPR-associated RAMP protein Csm3 [Ignavibacteria bacterium]
MKKQKFKVTLKILTGLHIGQGNDKVQIGGVDSAVIKDPITNLPYIPGSSLKGKIRCLLETEADDYKGNDSNGERNALLNKCFGINNSFKKLKDEQNKEKRKNNQPEEEYETPTRLIFRDLFLSKPDEENFKSGNINTEFKTEIVINRNKGTAEDGGLRTIERVPPSITFDGELILRYIDNEETEIKKVLDKGIELLNNDYLGGSGSRGYGAIEMKIEEKK